MKFLAVILVGILLGGCNSTEDITDQLTDGELEALRARAAAECLATSPARYSNFDVASSRIYDPSSVKWQRDYGWKHSLKQGTTELETQEIRVWKNTGTDLFLYINHKTVGGTVENKYFLRIPSAVNSQMVDDLKYETCIRELTTSGSDDGPLTSIKKVEVNLNPGKRITTTTFNFDFSLPVYAGSAWKYTRQVDTTDVPNTANTTASVTGTLTEWTGQPALQSTPSSHAELYCDFTAPNASPDFDYTLPYQIDTTSCEASAAAAGWVGFDI